MSHHLQPLERRTLLASFSGTIFNDRNNSATYESPDLPIGGATVYIDANQNGAFDTGERSVVSGSMLGGSWGQYRFDNLPSGTYHVRVVPPANFVQTFPAANAARVVTVTDPFAVLGVHLGLRDTTQSSRIGGSTWLDADGSQTLNNAEPTLPGVTVYADLDDDAVLDPSEPRTTSNASGSFTLDVLNPGFTTTYRIRAVPPAGHTQTTQPTTSGAHVVTIDAGNATMPAPVFGFRDTAPPAVVQARYLLDAPSKIHFTLSEPSVNTSWTVGFALSVVRLPDNTPLPAGTFTLDTNANGVLSYRLSPSAGHADGRLPEGSYRATLAANTLRDAAGNTNASAYSFDFHFHRGDLDRNGVVNNQDIAAFVQGLTDPSAYSAAFGHAPLAVGDVNGDGAFNNQDIAPFVALLTGGRPTPPPLSPRPERAARPLALAEVLPERPSESVFASRRLVLPA
jgi:hypothetical protein